MVKLIGILNLTPDSFSDGGKFNQLNSALKQIQKLIHDGANIIDIGAESTRPNASPINHEIEWERLKNILPPIINLAHKNKVQISLDSRHFQTIKKSLDLGIDIINDVSGFTDSKMIDLAVLSQKPIILMHNLGVPADKNKIIDLNLDEISVIKNWAQAKIDLLQKAGIKKNNIIFDPGIGFGKNASQSINILKNIAKFKILGVEIIIGHSRKSFLDCIQFDPNFGEDNKDNRTLFISKELIKNGVDYLRIHDVLNHAKLKLD